MRKKIIVPFFSKARSYGFFTKVRIREFARRLLTGVMGVKARAMNRAGKHNLSGYTIKKGAVVF